MAAWWKVANDVHREMRPLQDSCQR